LTIWVGDLNPNFDQAKANTEKLFHKSVLKGRGFSRAVQDRVNTGL